MYAGMSFTEHRAWMKNRKAVWGMVPACTAVQSLFQSLCNEKKQVNLQDVWSHCCSNNLCIIPAAQNNPLAAGIAA
jgi:hypothetical protein